MRKSKQTKKRDLTKSKINQHYQKNKSHRLEKKNLQLFLSLLLLENKNENIT